jgi:hypothetical protein
MRREYAPHLSTEKLREGVVGGSLHVVSCCNRAQQLHVVEMCSPPLSALLLTC